MKDEFGTNTNVLADKNDTYVETLVVNNKMINVFMNDPGQCYWFQWIDDNGMIQSMSCGTYCFDYKNIIEDFFEPSEEKLNERIENLKWGLIETNRDIAYLIKKLKKHFPNENFERPEGEL